MTDGKAKPTEEQEQPKPTPEATPIGYGLVGAFVGAAAMVICGLIFWSLTQWIPDDPKIASSTYFRNGLLGIAAFIGLALAIWRGTQTDKQIELTQQGLKESREQFALAQSESKQEQERQTFREASTLFNYKEPGAQLAGAILLQELASKSSLSDAAHRVLMSTINDHGKFIGSSDVDHFLINYVAEQRRPSSAVLNSAQLEGLFRFEKARRLTLRNCTIEDMYVSLRPRKIDGHFKVGDFRFRATNCLLSGQLDLPEGTAVQSSIVSAFFRPRPISLERCWIDNLVERPLSARIWGNPSNISFSRCYCSSASPVAKLIEKHNWTGIEIIDEDDKILIARTKRRVGPVT